MAGTTPCAHLPEWDSGNLHGVMLPARDRPPQEQPQLCCASFRRPAPAAGVY